MSPLLYARRRAFRTVVAAARAMLDRASSALVELQSRAVAGIGFVDEGGGSAGSSTRWTALPSTTSTGDAAAGVARASAPRSAAVRLMHRRVGIGGDSGRRVPGRPLLHEP